MKNEKKQQVKWEATHPFLAQETTKKPQASEAMRQLEDLQKRARSLGRSYQYGGYQGL
ncbi:MAG: hypothetical protein JWP27_135 [Flaviaesturariibacter sp.]|nr:hypothetical protein [Flaviaesturariibacter sp.]